MLTLLWNSAAIRGYVRLCMPTNIAVDLLRKPRGLKWVIPVAAVATPTYLLAMSFCARLATDPGLGWLNVLVLLFAWNGMKLAWAAAMCPLWKLASSRRLVPSRGSGSPVGQLSK